MVTEDIKEDVKEKAEEQKGRAEGHKERGKEMGRQVQGKAREAMEGLRLEAPPESVGRAMPPGLLNWLTLGSMVGSITLYFMGRKQDAIFIGLWPPTLQALNSWLHRRD